MATISESLNPQNPKQQCIFYHYPSAYDVGENRHAGEVMMELAAKYNFTIIGAVPQTIVDGWEFWIEAENIVDMKLPTFIDVRRWKPVNCP